MVDDYKINKHVTLKVSHGRIIAAEKLTTNHRKFSYYSAANAIFWFFIIKGETSEHINWNQPLLSKTTVSKTNLSSGYTPRSELL